MDNYLEPNASLLTTDEGAVESPKADVNAAISAAAKLWSLRNETAVAYRETCHALAERVGKVSAEASPFSLEPGGALDAMNLIVGTGIGLADDVAGLDIAPGEAAVHLYTAEPISAQHARNFAASALGVNALTNNSAAVRVIHTGPVDMLAQRFRARPAPCGISISHVNVTAGTIGCLCQGRGRLLVLSNNHVLADVNAGTIGSDILQPGVADGGNTPANKIGVLERFVPISFTQPNMVDCATAWVSPSDVDPDIFYFQGGAPARFRISPTPVQALPGMTVGKSGRTTQLTAGRVIATGVTVNVNMGMGRIAQFVDQIALQGVSGMFSQGGDSGSLIWSWDNVRSPVGLLFAGGGGTTFANPIQPVLNALDIKIVSAF